MARVLLLVGIIFGVLWLLHWFRRTPPAQVARTLRKVGLWAVVGLLVLAVATGRLNPIFAAIGALIPVVLRLLQVAQLVPGIQRLLRSLGLGGPGLAGGAGPAGAAGGSASGPAQVSEIRTRFLSMRLEHGSGAMDGEVLDGPFAGRRLSDLGLDELLRMLELYREQDGQSAAVLEAYLDREHGPDWRDREGAGGGAAGASASKGGALSESEAWALLGLEPGADETAIRAAHRRLMQKLHPDRGGSDYLAAKINEAKRVLLRERS